tara:strand:- start:11089 stop:11775 length:687 start_codon:yes stop_codon:yes gene_type:complete
MINKIIDLTLLLGGNEITPVPGLIGVETTPLQTHLSHARSNTKLTLPTHIGTHVDAPYHFIESGETLENVALEKFIGPGLLLDLRETWRPKTGITLEHLQTSLNGRFINGDDIVVLFTGWTSSNSGKSNYYSEGPYLSNEAATFLVDQKTKAVAIDFPIDKHPPTPNSTINDFPVHRILLGAGIPIIENLINLHLLTDTKFTLSALPLKLKGGDGSATRAVAFLGNPF